MNKDSENRLFLNIGKNLLEQAYKRSVSPGHILATPDSLVRKTVDTLKIKKR